MQAETIRWELGEDGICVLTFDDPNASANTMSAAYVTSMEAALADLEANREALRGVILTSAKRTFFAGADLKELVLVEPGDPTGYGVQIRRIKEGLRRLETLGVPVVAALGGAALGGGLEIALAAHHRVAVADAVRVGFPEVTLGLLPGAGGVVRSVRMFGVRTALEELLLPGAPLDAEAARKLGLLDALVESPEELLDAARAWIAANPDAAQPWDRDGYELPGGAPAELAADGTLGELEAGLAKRVRSAHEPAPAAILAVAVDGAAADFEAALEIETVRFLELASGRTATNMIESTFFDLQALRARGRGGEREPYAPRRAVVLGAGMMGAGIAHACAGAGLEVVLKDVDLAAAERGKAHSEGLVASAVGRGRMGEGEGAALLDRIHPSADPAAADGVDLMIEAVFENAELKSKVYAEIEPHLAPDALLGSNTSSLPISELAASVSRPADFIGLHFFSPVHRMPLLEIIRGAATSADAVDRALDVARLLGKTPIVVNDSRGFFTSRVITIFIDEGIAMLGEGIDPAAIEAASKRAGYPAPVLQLADELNLKLLRRIRDEGRAAVEAEGATWPDHPAGPVVDRMLDELERPGRLEGAGFYDYVDGRRVGLWPELASSFDATADASPDLEYLAERMLFVEALEAARTFEERVIESPLDANVGSLLGIGFPAWTGGVLRYIDSCEGGPAAFVDRALEFAAAHGDRFDPPASLVEMAAGGGRYGPGY
jgi:3-hydroxyacyl-CoA dehydrogenase / enoyl-CoA hydratase / 3-hydroxybutyryl-CoA epimerase